MGIQGDDLFNRKTSPEMTSSVTAFYMDETEITITNTANLWSGQETLIHKTLKVKERQVTYIWLRIQLHKRRSKLGGELD